MKTPNRTLTVKASQIQKAIARAKTFCPKDWQAEILEILLIPSVNRRWRAVNSDHFPELVLERHPGLPWTGGRDEALVVGDWTAYAGYTLGYGMAGYCWNRARANYYGHSPSSTWDGVRRETYCGFAENLRIAYGEALEGKEPNIRVERMLWDYRVRFVNDL